VRENQRGLLVAQSVAEFKEHAIGENEIPRLLAERKNRAFVGGIVGVE
jgi:hypothetical protein